MKTTCSILLVGLACVFAANAQTTSSNSVPPEVIFTAGNTNAAAGTTVQIPITATIQGIYPIRMLMLNLNVLPQAGAPAIPSTTPVLFTPSAAVGGPTTTTNGISLSDSHGAGNYAAVWGLAGNGLGLTNAVNLIGTLSVSIPSWAPSGSTYTVNFDHASASPNGLASFPKLTVPGTITVQ
jgi:hypothetical protein